jgi:hypothetical protein
MQTRFTTLLPPAPAGSRRLFRSLFALLLTPGLTTTHAQTTWTGRTVSPALWFSVTYGNGLFVAVAITGTNRVMTSPNGITWTAHQAAGGNAWSLVTSSGKEQFVAVAKDGTNRVMTAFYDEAALPVTMRYGNGRITDAGALLGWATAREDNNARFNIERSCDRNVGPELLPARANRPRRHIHPQQNHCPEPGRCAGAGAVPKPRFGVG